MFIYAIHITPWLLYHQQQQQNNSNNNSKPLREGDAAQRAQVEALIASQAASLALVRQVIQVARRVGVREAVPE